MRHKWLKIGCTLSRPFVYLPEGWGSVSHDPPVSCTWPSFCIFIIKRCNDNGSKEQALFCPQNECKESKISYACKRDAGTSIQNKWYKLERGRREVKNRRKDLCTVSVL